jgi:hypothetical protein
MDLQSRLRQYKPLLDTLGCTKREESLGFGDFMWGQFDFDEWVDRILHHRDPGVKFTTANRIFVMEEHQGELRFDAGGWNAAVYDEPNELGVFPSVGEALAYAVDFLVHGLPPRDIGVQRVLPR